MIFATGEFQNVPFHTMEGNFTLERVGSDVLLKTHSDFFFDGAAPGPAWALGTLDGKPIPDFVLGSVFKVLKPQTPVEGVQEILIPAAIFTDEIEAIITWCTIAKVPLGVGHIEFI